MLVNVMIRGSACNAGFEYYEVANLFHYINEIQ